MKNDLDFCPKCGKKILKNYDNRCWKCPECGFVLYCNVAAAVGVIFSDKNKNVLFEIRAKNPRKGFLALPGGFVDPNESAEEAAKRECKEEIGVDLSEVKFVCTNPNTYEYKNIEYKTCDMFFTAELPERFETMQDFILSLKKQESEVTGFASYKIETEKDIENIPIAFESTKETLKKWIKM